MECHCYLFCGFARSQLRSRRDDCATDLQRTTTTQPLGNLTHSPQVAVRMDARAIPACPRRPAVLPCSSCLLQFTGQLLRPPPSLADSPASAHWHQHITAMAMDEPRPGLRVTLLLGRASSFCQMTEARLLPVTHQACSRHAERCKRKRKRKLLLPLSHTHTKPLYLR